MKRLMFLIVTVLLIYSSTNISAEEKDGKTNDLGIIEGTEVYGEDISELNEEELQYIPEGWRDGNVESTHETEGDLEDISLFRSAFPDVNTYIKNNNNKLSISKVKYDHNPVFEKFNYRNGFGSVEGVVAHETANDSSNINNELDFMNRNHENAFVHAFVDYSNIIEIHPTNLGAWGAGHYANQRFIHVELVRVNTFDQFARSINNYTDYIASILYKYNLGVKSAEKSGNGTLWSHNAVSKHLGATDHVDPHGYFAKWGYNWKDFSQLVEDKYAKKVRKPQKNTSKLGHITSNNSKIYSDPTKLNNYIKAGTKNKNEVFYIKASAKLKGKLYYLISKNPSSKKGTVGWIKGENMKVHNHKGVDRKKKIFEIHGSGKAYSKAWGGSENLVYNLSDYKGKQFTVNLTEKVGNNTWYRGILDGRQVWIHNSYLVNSSSTSKLGHLKSGNVKIYGDLEKNSNYIKAGNQYTNAVYYIKKQAKVRRGTYYLISSKPSSTKGIIGWVNSKDISTHAHKGLDKNAKIFAVKGTGKAYGKAWGGKKDLVYNLSNYKSQEFKVHLTETVGANTWYRGKLNGKTVWMHSSYVTTKQESKTSKLGHLRTGSTIYKTIGDKETAIDSAPYLNAVYYIKRQTEVGDAIYYLISTKPSSTKGTIGWVNAKDLSTHVHKGLDRKPKTFAVKGTGKAYSKAWGGKKDLVYNLSDYKNQEFKVHLTETVGSNAWYRGKLDGKTVWMHSSYVTIKQESKTSKLGHLRIGSTIYKTIGDKDTAIDSASYLNAVYYIKKQTKIGSVNYYLISTKPSSTKGTIGWVNSKGLSIHMHKSVDKKFKTFVIKGSGKAYSKAWGGKKDLVYNLSDYKDREFKVHLTETVGANTWYRGYLEGKTVWLHSSFVK